MGNVVYKVDYESQTISNLKQVTGTLTMAGSYATSGDALNLANYFKSSTVPVVMLGGDDGVILESTSGRNAEALLIKAYNVGGINGAAANLALTEIGSTTNQVTVNSSFIAFGQPY